MGLSGRAMGLAVAMIIVLAACASRARADSSPAFLDTSPSLSFSGHSAKTTFEVSNPTSQQLTVAFALRLLPLPTPAYPRGKTKVLPPNSVTVVSLDFAQKFRTTYTGATLVMRTLVPKSTGAAAPTAPQTVQLSIVRITSWALFVFPLLAGLLLMLVCLANIGGGGAGTIEAPSGWNFSDSIVTNSTAIGGLLATALAAFGSSSSLLPGVQTDRVALLSALWTGLAVLGPVIVGAKTDPDEGAGSSSLLISRNALLGAIALVLIAVGAQLCTLSLLVFETTLPLLAKLSATGAFVVAGGVAGYYVSRTTETLAKSPAERAASNLHVGARVAMLP